MFGRREAVAEKPVVPRPAPQPVPARTFQLDTYEKLAEELDYRPAQLLQERLLRFFAANNIPLFNYGAVDAYLRQIAEADGKKWIWRPLREKDIPTWSVAGHDNDTFGHGSYFPGHNQYRPYHRAVPIHILRQVKLIETQFANQVGFFVSDYAVAQPDPFIMVRALDTDPLIFGVWDEPGFGVEPTP